MLRRMIFSTSRQLNRAAVFPVTTRFFSDIAKLVHIELRSGRVGKLKIESQADLEKLLERSGALALVEGEDQEEPVVLNTKLENLKSKPVYHFAYGYDESEIYDEDDEEEDLERNAA